MSGKVVAAVGGVAAAAGLMTAYIARGRTMSEGVHYITTNDGVRLAYEVRGLGGPTVVLIHGWSGSRRYFDLNVEHLAQSCRVVLVDLRFHGDSDKPEWGFHVARLAADLNDLLSQTWIGATKPALLGTSLGCAVIWSYVELYGQASVSKLIFVDQALFNGSNPHPHPHPHPLPVLTRTLALTSTLTLTHALTSHLSPLTSHPHPSQAPSQWVYPDWKLGSKGIYIYVCTCVHVHVCTCVCTYVYVCKGIYDPPSLINIQNAVKDLDAFADGNAACCLTRPVHAACACRMRMCMRMCMCMPPDQACATGY